MEDLSLLPLVSVHPPLWHDRASIRIMAPGTGHWDMAFTEAERTDIRRHCGYPTYGAGPAGFQGWRFHQAFGLMEYRLSHLSGSEEIVVRNYLGTLLTLERAIPQMSEHLDTDVAAVWSRNKAEFDERTRLFDGWRRRLCGFLGLPPGPALSDGSIRMVV